MLNSTRTTATFGFAIRERRVYLLAVLVLLVVVILDHSLNGVLLSQSNSFWKNSLEPFVSFATFLTAIAVWWGEVTQDWKNSIPKKLTVVFLYQGQVVMQCNRADLASEADIRALGQQIGSQMAGTRDLQFIAPRVTPTGGDVCFAREGGFFRDYKVTFELTELPRSLAEQPKSLNVKECVEWDPPFSDKKRIPLP